MTLTLKLLLAIAATVLLILAGIVALGDAALGISAFALLCFGLACLAGAHWIP